MKYDLISVQHRSPFCVLCRTVAAHIIVQFTLRLLSQALPSLSESDESHSLCGAFLFVCRQMYNTCEGLQVLQTYSLHKAIAAAWQKVQLQCAFVNFPAPVFFDSMMRNRSLGEH